MHPHAPIVTSHAQTHTRTSIHQAPRHPTAQTNRTHPHTNTHAPTPTPTPTPTPAPTHKHTHIAVTVAHRLRKRQLSDVVTGLIVFHVNFAHPARDEPLAAAYMRKLRQERARRLSHPYVLPLRALLPFAFLSCPLSSLPLLLLFGSLHHGARDHTPGIWTSAH